MSRGPDEIYYAHAGKLPFTSRMSLLARKRIFSLFMETINPSAAQTVLDLGVSADLGSMEANALEQMYPWRERITCAGVEDASAVEKAYPGVTFKRIAPRGPLPFTDKQFDVVFSNAVLEHVGSREKQAEFVREALRVGKRLFLVVPNRLFPVEHHTGIPLLHWLPAPLFRALLRPTPFKHWAEEENLNHLTARSLRALFPGESRVRVLHAGLPAGPFSSNIAAYTC